MKTYKILKLLTKLAEYSFSPNPSKYKSQAKLIAEKLIKLDDSFDPAYFFKQNSWKTPDEDADWYSTEELLRQLKQFDAGYLVGNGLYLLCLKMNAIIYTPDEDHLRDIQLEKHRRDKQQKIKNKSKD